MANEIVYTIPLGKVYESKPCYKRANKAIAEIRRYLVRHSKIDDSRIKLDNKLNELINARGSKKPPRKIQVKAVKKPKLDAEGKELKDEKGAVIQILEATPVQ